MLHVFLIYAMICSSCHNVLCIGTSRIIGITPFIIQGQYHHVSFRIFHCHVVRIFPFKSSHSSFPSSTRYGYALFSFFSYFSLAIFIVAYPLNMRPHDKHHPLLSHRILEQLRCARLQPFRLSCMSQYGFPHI